MYVRIFTRKANGEEAVDIFDYLPKAFTFFSDPEVLYNEFSFFETREEAEEVQGKIYPVDIPDWLTEYVDHK